MRWTLLLLLFPSGSCRSADALSVPREPPTLDVRAHVDAWYARAARDGVLAAAEMAEELGGFGAAALPHLRGILRDLRASQEVAERALIAVELSRLIAHAEDDWLARGVAPIPEWMRGRWRNDAYEYHFTDRTWFWTRTVGGLREEYPPRLMRVIGVDGDRIRLEVQSFGPFVFYRAGALLMAETEAGGERQLVRLYPR